MGNVVVWELNKLVEFVINEFGNILSIVFVLVLGLSLNVSRLWHFWDLVGFIPLLFLEIRLSGKRFGSLSVEIIPSFISVHSSKSGSSHLSCLLLEWDIFSIVEVVLSLQKRLVSLNKVGSITNNLSSMSLWDAVSVVGVISNLEQVLVHSLGDHIFQSDSLLTEVHSVSDNLSGMAFWDAISVILMLILLWDLGIKIQEALVYWVDLNEFVKFVVNELRDILGIILMLVVDVSLLIWEVISV